MASRGVIYIVWGDSIAPFLKRSRESLAAFHPDLPVEVISTRQTDPVHGLKVKSTMMSLSPFEETLFLDADTVVLDRLDFGFEKAVQHGLACAICESPWLRRYTGQKGDLIEYNTGVLFFTRKAEPVFKQWEALAPKVDSSINGINDKGVRYNMPFNDQASFALALETTGFNPFVLPLNWNFRPRWHKSFFGTIKIWHDYDNVPPQIVTLTDYYRKPDSVVQFHRAI